MTEFDEFFSDIRRKLENDNKIREELIRESRRSIQNSSLAIRHMHRDDIENAKTIISKNQEEIARINTLAQQMSTSPFGLILSCNQEFAESVFLYSFLSSNPFPSSDDLNIPYIAYLHGIPDFIGELRRVILDSLRKKKGLDVAVEALNLMDDLHSLLITLDYPDGLTYNLRRKIDRIKNLTEKTRGDVTLALNRMDLVESFEKILKKYQDTKVD